MRFEASDLLPDYDVESIEKLFFVRRDLADLDKADQQRLLDKVNCLGLKETRYDNVMLILCAMHEAREVDQGRFINEVFLPWHSLRKKTQLHLDRICKELSRVCEFEAGSVDEAAHLVNIYRNQVSDLFDPYMTLLVACFQFKEGKFTTLSDADLTNGERTKSEYLTKRVKEVFSGETFLDGYDPLVRNAISHAGSRGITYLNDRVVFKNIKRELPPRVETVVWPFDELQLRILKLMESVLSIEAAVEIFGLDCSSIIVSDFGTQLNFAFHALSPQQVVEWKTRTNKVAAKVREAQDIGDKEKHELLSQMLFYNCELRKMPCHGARFSSKGSAICVDVPIATLDVDDDDQLVKRLYELIRYAILARTLFAGMYDNVIVIETDPERTEERICGRCAGADLDQWIDEKSGLVDILSDSKWSIGGQPLSVAVDFEKLDQAELESPDMPFPRRGREES